MNRPWKPISERFWAKVDKSGECWLWTASIRGPGPYGQIGLGGQFGGVEYAHRVSWMLHFGEIPAGLDVCHHCDRPACVRPDHLFLGTRKDNMQDAKAKGRMSPPPRSTQKLMPDDVLAIRAVQAAAISGTVKRTDRALASQYGMHPATIRAIRLRRLWPHLPAADEDDG